ncbi:hypothetical protein THRCLA_00445 [Thraustotheca clavata]|uniref:SPRY domain-containing protein n=1 Tax=Thraustotheca clavata TaxID=74557 RepID=A0A1W0AB74_9STRA|nr:hypothetical protein THRCLA_00445 [Thraustotheca clavata]
MKRAEDYGAPTKRMRTEDENGPEEDKKTIRFVEKGTLLTIADNGLMVLGTKGYCMARTNIGAKSGNYYYEITLQPSEIEYHVRFGYGTKKADINGPVGFDEYSFAYRDLQGSIVHKSTRKDGYGDAFGNNKAYEWDLHSIGPGDTVGALIYLPPVEAIVEEPPHLEGSTNPSPGPIGKLGSISFFVNGKDQGVAFADIPCGEDYYPCVSIYHAGSIVANFGPEFTKPPNVSIPISSFASI